MAVLWCLTRLNLSVCNCTLFPFSQQPDAVTPSGHVAPESQLKAYFCKTVTTLSGPCVSRGVDRALVTVCKVKPETVAVKHTQHPETTHRSQLQTILWIIALNNAKIYWDTDNRYWVEILEFKCFCIEFFFRSYKINEEKQHLQWWWSQCSSHPSMNFY